MPAALLVLVGDGRGLVGRGLLARNSPGRQPAGAPLLIAQGNIDPIVRPAVTARFVGQLRSRGERVRFVQLDLIGHLVAGSASTYSVIPWLDARLAGAVAPNDNLFDSSFRHLHPHPRELQWF